jgi:hypothetical protein
LSIPSDALRPEGAFSLCLETFSFKDASTDAENFTLRASLVPLAESFLFFDEPLI